MDIITSTCMILIKFLFQTSLFSQYLSNGTWKIAGLVKEVSETAYVPDPFQWIHVIGIYKTASTYVCEYHNYPYPYHYHYHQSPPAFSSIIWDLLFLLVLNFYKSQLRRYGIADQSAEDRIMEEVDVRMMNE